MHNHNGLSLFHISRSYLSNSTLTPHRSHLAAVFSNTIVSIHAAVLCSPSTYPSPPSLRRFTSFISFIVSPAWLWESSATTPTSVRTTYVFNVNSNLLINKNVLQLCQLRKWSANCDSFFIYNLNCDTPFSLSMSEIYCTGHLALHQPQ